MSESKVGSIKTERALLAGGCFWGVQELLRKLPGVLQTRVGYTGGTLPNAKYRDVKTGTTGHAEAVEIIFDPNKISFLQILDFFFRMHDPTTLNQQGNDKGSQYRSSIFYLNPQQKMEAQQAIAAASENGLWKKPIVTEVMPAAEFWDAEPEHQDYLQNNPSGYTCHWIRR